MASHIVITQKKKYLWTQNETAESYIFSHLVWWSMKCLGCHQNCTPVKALLLGTMVAFHLCRLFSPLLHSLLMPGHCLPGCCGQAALLALNEDLSGGCGVWQSFTGGPCRKGHRPPTGRHENSAMSVAKALHQQPLLAYLQPRTLQGRLASPQRMAFATPSHTKSDPSNFSRLHQQEETDVPSPHVPVHATSLFRHTTLCGSFFGQYAKFQLL